MAKTTNPRKAAKETHQIKVKNQPPERREKEKPHRQLQQPQLPSWAVMRSILTCKHLEVEQQQPTPRTQKTKQKKQTEKPPIEEIQDKKSKKMRCSGSLCNNTMVMQKPEPASPETLQRKNRATPAKSSNSSIKKPILREISNIQSINNNGFFKKPTSSNSSSKGMPFRKFSGCYECRMVVDPVLGFTRDPSLRATIYSCPDCGEVFMKAENLELHQAVRHAGIHFSFFNKNLAFFGWFMMPVSIHLYQ